MDEVARRNELLRPDLHGSSVGEASARQTSHCPPASKDVRQGGPGTPGLRVSLMWLRSSGSLTARGAEAWTSGGIRQQSCTDSWPFLPRFWFWGNGLF